MSSLVDFQIRDLCCNLAMVEPFDSELVNPASLDVRLGNVIKREGRICGPAAQRTRWIEHYVEDAILFLPKVP